MSEIIEETTPAQSLHTGAKDHLRAFVERIERLEEEKAALAEDIREVYAEAKSSGFDAKALREIVRMRKLADHERQEREGLLATYMHALGMMPGLK
ncbi:MAG: DUF2312 domain-containing protein [Alphaproteobacteria bacterium]